MGANSLNEQTAAKFHNTLSFNLRSNVVKNDTVTGIF